MWVICPFQARTEENHTFCGFIHQEVHDTHRLVVKIVMWIDTVLEPIWSSSSWLLLLLKEKESFYAGAIFGEDPSLKEKVLGSYLK